MNVALTPYPMIYFGIIQHVGLKPCDWLATGSRCPQPERIYDYCYSFGVFSILLKSAIFFFISSCFYNLN